MYVRLVNVSFSIFYFRGWGTKLYRLIVGIHSAGSIFAIEVYENPASANSPGKFMVTMKKESRTTHAISVMKRL